MKLTPIDINNKEFKKGIRGYSVEEGTGSVGGHEAFPIQDSLLLRLS